MKITTETSSTMNFEQAILNQTVDLTQLDQATPLETSEQKRQQWLKERLGKFTASEFYRLVTAPSKADLPVGAITSATEKAVESLTDYLEPGYISSDMQWGMDHELDAIALFEQQTGLTVTHTGDDQALILRSSQVGGTPDGLIGSFAGVEVKCPKSTTHMKHLMLKDQSDLKDNCPNYYWQIQGLLYITGRKDWYFISYDPRYKHSKQQLHTLLIQPDEQDIAFLVQRLGLVINYRDELLNTMHQSTRKELGVAELLSLFKIGRTSLWKLRQNQQFPQPVQQRPLLWRAADIDQYALNS